MLALTSCRLTTDATKSHLSRTYNTALVQYTRANTWVRQTPNDNRRQNALNMSRKWVKILFYCYTALRHDFHHNCNQSSVSFTTFNKLNKWNKSRKKADFAFRTFMNGEISEWKQFHNLRLTPRARERVVIELNRRLKMESLNRNLFNAHCSSSEQIFQSDNALTFKSVIHFTIPTFIGVAFSTFHLVTMGLNRTEPQFH